MRSMKAWASSECPSNGAGAGTSILPLNWVWVRSACAMAAARASGVKSDMLGSGGVGGVGGLGGDRYV